MKNISILFCLMLFSSFAMAQASEEEGDGYRSYYVILIIKDGQVKNSFKEGMGISAKIDGKTVNGNWYYKIEPDVVTVVGKNGEVLGTIKLNEQKTLKLETNEPKSGGGMSFGIGMGPVGVSTGGGGGPSYMTYNMEKHQATFDLRKETKEEKIRREYEEKKEMERLEKEAKRQAKKANKK